MESEDTVRRSGRLSQKEAAAAESMPAPAGKPCGRSGKKGGESRGRSVAPWSEKVPGETLETYTARVTSMFKSHERGKAALSKLQGELQQAEALYSSTSEKKRTGIAEHIQKLRGRIAEVEECQAIIERNAGPFREKFLNDRRFLDMKRRGEKEEACVGGPAGAVDMPSDSCASRADALPSAAASAGEAPPTAETPPSGPACVPPPSQPSVQPGVRAQPTAPPTTETPPSGPTCVPAPSQPSVQSGVRAPPATPPIAPPTAVSGASRTGSLDGGEERSGRGLAGGGQEALPAMEDVVDETQGSQPVMASQENIYSGLRPDQVALPSSGSSAEEEDMEGSQGLMTAIRLQESPVSLQHFQFGDEDPGPGKAKRRQRKKAQETVLAVPVVEGRRFVTKHSKKALKASLTLGILLGMFFVAWLPFFIANMVQAVCDCVPPGLFDVLTWLGYCNSTMNPIIYPLFMRDFKRAMGKYLPCCRRSRVISVRNSNSAPRLGLSLRNVLTLRGETDSIYSATLGNEHLLHNYKDHSTDPLPVTAADSVNLFDLEQEMQVHQLNTPMD